MRRDIGAPVIDYYFVQCRRLDNAAAHAISWIAHLRPLPFIVLEIFAKCDRETIMLNINAQEVDR